jgi:predicted transcriptional regulator
LDNQTDGDVALLSIRPEYAERILTGEKTWEFRRVRFKRNVTHLLLYASQPIGKIVGIVEVTQILEQSPERLWIACSGSAGIKWRAYETYFNQVDIGFAIELGRVVRFREPLELRIIKPVGRPPQSFEYLPAAVLSQLEFLDA